MDELNTLIAKRRETAFKIAFQIVDIFEADVETQGRTLRVPNGGGSCRLAVERHDQAFKAAPGVAHAENAQRIQHALHRCVRVRLQEDREKSARAQKIAPPQLMARVAGESRVHHRRNLGARLQPFGNGEARLPMPFQPHREGAEPAKGEKAVFAIYAEAKSFMGGCERPCRRCIASDRAEKRICVTDDILRRRLDGNVNAVVEGAEIKRCGPRIVDGDGDATPARRFADRRDILHLEGLGTREIP